MKSHTPVSCKNVTVVPVTSISHTFTHAFSPCTSYGLNVIHTHPNRQSEMLP